MPYDSDTTAVSEQTDTQLGEAYEGADRLTEKYRFPLQITALYATVIVTGYVVHLAFESQLAQTLAALMTYFTLLFAAISVVLGVLFKVAEALWTDR